MPRDVFISYTSDDREHRDRLHRLLHEELKLSVFVDRHDIDGGALLWETIAAAIRDAATTVVVLTARTGAAPWVRREVEEARRLGRTVIPIVFDDEGKAYATSSPALREHLFIDARLLDDTGLLSALWRALYRAIVNVEQWREESRQWADKRLGLLRLDFWAGADRSLFGEGTTPTEGVVLVGSGGAGKSILLARYVRRLLDDRDVVPIVLEPASIPRVVGASARARAISAARLVLGARGDVSPSEHVRYLEHLLGKLVVFVVDGIDVALAGDAGAYLPELLDVLDAAGVVVATCRLEAWDARLIERVHLRRIDVPGLSAGVLSERLRDLPPGLIERIPALRLPVYLDLALRHGGLGLAQMTTVTQLLRQVEIAITRGRVPDQYRDDRIGTEESILRAIAGLQFERLAYEVPREVVLSRCAGPPDLTAALGHLIDDGMVIEIQRRDGVMIRRRHELLDAFGMAELLGPPRAGREQRVRLYASAASEIGHSVLAALIRMAKDDGSAALVNEVLDALVTMQDRKRLGPDHMNRAWAGSYALREIVGSVVQEIATYLGGEHSRPIRTPADFDHPESGSRLAPPRCSDEAASTLADALASLPSRAPPLADLVVPALARGVTVYKLRARLIEALAHYRTPGAVDAIISAGHDACTNDPELLPYVASALAECGGLAKAASVSLLRHIVTLPAAPERARRQAVRAAHRIAPLETDDLVVPPFAEPELLEGLRVVDARGDYSDWRMVADHLKIVEANLRRGETPSPAVDAAVRKTLRHEHAPVQAQAVRVLAGIDLARALPVLLGRLLDDDVANDVVRAVREGVADAVSRAPPARQHAIGVMLSLGRRWAQRHQRDASANLIAGIANEIPRSPWLADAFGAEIPLEGPTDAYALHGRVVDGQFAGGQFGDLATVGERGETGPGQEAKLRIVGFAPARNEVALAPTTWEQGRAFHIAVPRIFDRGSAAELERLLEAVAESFGGTVRLPGLACVHAVVVTGDDELVWSQRSASVAYSPLAWSASYEEQLRADDARPGGDPFVEAAARGFEEEFGLALAPGDEVRPCAAILELEVLNMAVVVLVRTSHSSEALKQSWPRARDHWESTAIDFTAIPAARAGEPTLHDGSLHPTSALRVQFLQRALRPI